MGAQGNTTVDFGGLAVNTPNPGTAEASTTVTGQTGILVTSAAEAWLRCESSADHSSDEHDIEDLDVYAKDIVAGVGFTIIVRPRFGKSYGIFNVSWVWN